MRDRRARFAPAFEVGAAPGDCARAESDGARKLVVSDEAVDRRATETGPAQHRRHAQEQRSRIRFRRGKLVGVALHRRPPFATHATTVGADAFVGRAGFRLKSCNGTHSPEVHDMHPALTCASWLKGCYEVFCARAVSLVGRQGTARKRRSLSCVVSAANDWTYRIGNTEAAVPNGRAVRTVTVQARHLCVAGRPSAVAYGWPQSDSPGSRQRSCRRR